MIINSNNYKTTSNKLLLHVLSFLTDFKKNNRTLSRYFSFADSRPLSTFVFRIVGLMLTKFQLKLRVSCFGRVILNI